MTLSSRWSQARGCAEASHHLWWWQCCSCHGRTYTSQSSRDKIPCVVHLQRRGRALDEDPEREWSHDSGSDRS